MNYTEEYLGSLGKTVKTLRQLMQKLGRAFQLKTVNDKL